MHDCRLCSCSSAEVRTLQMTTSSSCGLQACVQGSLRDSEGLLFLRLSHGPLFSPLAFAVPATQTQGGSLTQGDASACQGCLDQAHQESKPLIITFNRSSQRELRIASLNQREGEASFQNFHSSRYLADRSCSCAKSRCERKPRSDLRDC